MRVLLPGRRGAPGPRGRFRPVRRGAAGSRRPCPRGRAGSAAGGPRRGDLRHRLTVKGPAGHRKGPGLRRIAGGATIHGCERSTTWSRWGSRPGRSSAEADPGWQPVAGLVVGHDVVGGVFALDGGDPAAAGRPGALGQMTYFAPDTPAWEAMELGHSGWGAWLLSGRLELFYDGLRWPGWREEAAALDHSQGIAVYPFLWSEEAHADLAATSRRPVPMREVLGVAADAARRTGTGEAGFLGEV
ncbi:DUF2625 family protein [Streptomyces albidoflavus]